MALRELLLCAAVPVTPELERSAGQQRHVHHVLRGDGVISRVFGHVQATAAAATCRDVGTLTTEDELLPAPPPHVHSHRSVGLPDIIPASDPSLPSTPDVTAGLPAAPPPSSDLHWAIQLWVTHFRHGPPPPWKGGRVTRRDLARGRGARPRDKPGSGGGDKPGSGCMTDTLRHVGHELRRIADQLQLNRLVGWPTHEEIMYDVISAHPLLSGLAGGALICGVTAGLNRALRR